MIQGPCTLVSMSLLGLMVQELCPWTTTKDSSVAALGPLRLMMTIFPVRICFFLHPARGRGILNAWPQPTSSLVGGRSNLTRDRTERHLFLNRGTDDVSIHNEHTHQPWKTKKDSSYHSCFQWKSKNNRGEYQKMWRMSMDCSCCVISTNESSRSGEISYCRARSFGRTIASLRMTQKKNSH